MRRASAARTTIWAVLLGAGAAFSEDPPPLFPGPGPGASVPQSRPLWFWNGPLDKDKTRRVLEECKAAGYSGVGILPAPGMRPEFLSPEYLDHYKTAVETAARLGMKCCLYDEFWFPSGSAGGRLAEEHPEALGKRLDMAVTDVRGPVRVRLRSPEGVFMGAVAMRPDGGDRRNISRHVRDGVLSWDAPAGAWRAMAFACVTDGSRGLVDYLDPESVECFLALTYDKYYEAFPEHFSTTIDTAFYDEPTFHWVEGGRAWTPRFNERFEATHGYSPLLLYPALWYDIGPETSAARNALFGFRAELYATGFPKVLADWCAAHDVELTGHVDQEEIVNPVGLCGDLMKAFRHQQIPGIDQIFAYGRASKAYKIVSSAAYNYDRPLVLTECYGGIKDMPRANLYKEAMDQFARGINVMVPHAVWYDRTKIVFQPDLSPASETFGKELPAYNRYMGVLQGILQRGRHVADIAVLYPIATLQAGYFFGAGVPYEGGVIPPEADYMRVGELLSLEVRRDFTYLHPEVLDERCTVADGELRLDNRTNHESYRVCVLPGSRAVAWSNLLRIKEFYDRGGKVIATTRLPDASAELGKDAEVRAAVEEMFGGEALFEARFPRVSASSSWAGGGFEPELAADDDPATRWNSAAKEGGDQWLTVDFGSVETFEKAVIDEPFDRTIAFRIQAWDGVEWKDCATGGTLGRSKVVGFPSLSASKVRLCLDRLNTDCVSIAEFQVLDAEGRNLAARVREDVSGRPNPRGGVAVFLPRPSAASLRAALERLVAVGDVVFEEPVEVAGGNLSYIHKSIDGREVYFFANSSDQAVDTPVRLRGTFELEGFDPHSRRVVSVEQEHLDQAGEPTTRVRLRLGPVRSVFLASAAGTR